MVEDMAEEAHKRRVHYSGKYPKKFEEKYKEHNPEKYKDTVAHVISKGSTPAGTHISICVNEILDFFDIQPGQKGLDCTFGYGGHSKAMLEKLQGRGHLVSLDIDPIESAKTKARLKEAGFDDDVLTVKLTNFANIDEVAKECGPFDFILADLGVSSMQIDDPSRGFSYKIDGPLDLRMNPNEGISASERLAKVEYEELVGMLTENSDEPFAEEIAREILKRRKSGRCPKTTAELKETIEYAVKGAQKGISDSDVKKSCARVFQALRIDINHEFESLYSLLDKLPDALNPGGKVAILTFHSGEDRLVKKSFKEFFNLGLYSDFSRDVIRPSMEECITNPRAKSTKMRWAVKG